MGFAVWQTWLSSSLAGVAGGAMLPWISLALLVLGAIPFARVTERRWQRLAASSFPCPALSASYRRARLRLWLLAAITPPLAAAAVLGIARVTALF
jgi:hypothetical protein